MQDGRTVKEWELCKQWVAPGIDFVTETNSLYLFMEVLDLTTPYEAVLIVRAVREIHWDLELRHVSPTLGELQSTTHKRYICYVGLRVKPFLNSTNTQSW